MEGVEPSIRWAAISPPKESVATKTKATNNNTSRRSYGRSSAIFFGGAALDELYLVLNLTHTYARRLNQS